MSTFGELEERSYSKRDFTTVSGPEDPVMKTTDSFFDTEYQNEEAMNDMLFSKLISLTEVQDLEDDIIVINSERTLWLTDSDESEAKRKPDFLRVHKAFFKSAGGSHGSDQSLNYGGVLPFFVNQVLFIYEGKVDSIKTGHKNIGGILNYLNLLCDARALHPRGLLFNKYDLITIDPTTSELQYGAWSTTSKKELRKFILDVEYPKLTSALIRACKELHVRCTLGGYIAQGATAHVFEVEDIETGNLMA